MHAVFYGPTKTHLTAAKVDVRRDTPAGIGVSAPVRARKSPLPPGSCSILFGGRFSQRISLQKESTNRLTTNEGSANLTRLICAESPRFRFSWAQEPLPRQACKCPRCASSFVLEGIHVSPGLRANSPEGQPLLGLPAVGFHDTLHPRRSRCSTGTATKTSKVGSANTLCRGVHAAPRARQPVPHAPGPSRSSAPHPTPGVLPCMLYTHLRHVAISLQHTTHDFLQSKYDRNVVEI